MLRFAPRLAALLALASLTLPLTGCAGNECNFNSQCGRRMYCSAGSCQQDCRADTDCAGGRVCSDVGQCVVATDAGPEEDGGPIDSGRPPVDSGRVDTGRPPVDSGTPPPVDSGTPPPVDSGTPPGTGGYFDRCTVDGDCAAGVCVTDVGGARICTRSCTVHSNCAQGQVCAGGRCVRNDTGTTCSVASPASCALGLCLGPVGGAGACTRDCTSAIDCPSGYACTRPSPGDPKVCVDIEKPCTSGGSECATGICLSGKGCTASCDSASDCPNRLTSIGLPAYQCGAIGGVSGNVCLPPADVLGADPIGASCPPTGTIACRSGICNTLPPPLTGAMCTQVCDPVGGCGPSLGCSPVVNAGSVVMLCSFAGSRPIGDSCTTGRQCDSGVCDGSGRCTRLCEDGICPTGWRCERVALPGGPNICRP